MDQFITHLNHLLEKEITTFRALAESLEGTQGALIGQDPAGLTAAVEAQKELARTAVLQERDRNRIVRQIAVLLKENPQELTLQRLIDRVGPPLSDVLADRRETLLELHNTIDTINRQNSLLLKQSMKYVDKSLRILSGAGTNGNLYERSGKAEGTARRTPSLQGIVNRVI